MFFRGRHAEASIWRRFRASADGFTFASEDGYFSAHIVANAERVVDLFHSLTEHLPPAVDVALEDLRSGRSWKGEALPLDDVREQIARLKALLGRYGGVELSLDTVLGHYFPVTFAAGVALTRDPAGDRRHVAVFGRIGRAF